MRSFREDWLPSGWEGMGLRLKRGSPPTTSWESLTPLLPRLSPSPPLSSLWAARLVAAERGDTGPLQPLHIHVAHQRLQAEAKVETVRGRKKRLLL